MAGGDRSVCHLPNREAPSVFLTGLRSAGSRDRRSSPILGQSPGLCLSSDSHHKESSCQTEILEELRVNSHSSVLASEGMVPGPSGTIVRRSHHTVKSKRSTKTAPEGLPSLPSKGIGLCYQRFSNFRFRRYLLLLFLKTLFGRLRYLLLGHFSLLHLGIWIRFCSFSQAPCESIFFE